MILVDHFSLSYAVKMIDLSTIEIYDDPYNRDQGLITGVKNLIKFIKGLDSNNWIGLSSISHTNLLNEITGAEPSL